MLSRCSGQFQNNEFILASVTGLTIIHLVYVKLCLTACQLMDIKPYKSVYQIRSETSTEW